MKDNNIKNNNINNISSNNNNNMIIQFRLVFNNHLLRKDIFNHVKQIHRKRFGKCHFYSWAQFIKNEDDILVKINELKLFGECLDRLFIGDQENYRKMIKFSIKTAIRYGRIQFLQYLVNDRDIKLIDHHTAFTLITDVSRANNLELLVYLEQHLGTHIKPNDYSHSFSIKIPANGNLEMMKWISTKVNNRFIRDKKRSAITTATEHGHLSIIQWLFSPPSSITSSSAAASAAEDLNTTITMDDILNNGDKIGILYGDLTNIVDLALKSGHLRIVEWMERNRLIPDDYLSKLDKVAKSGNLECIKWACSNYQTVASSDAIDYASYVGKFDIVQWLHSNRSDLKCTTYAMNYAATHSLKMVEWFHHNRTEGCTTDAIDYAASKGHLDIVKWLYQNRSEGFSSRGVEHSVRNGYLEIFQFLIEVDPTLRRVRLDHIFESASYWGHLEIMQYMQSSPILKNRIQSTFDAMDQAATRGDIKCVEWLHANRTEGCSSQALIGAVMNGHSAIIEYLLANQLVQVNDDLFNFANNCNNYNGSTTKSKEIVSILTKYKNESQLQNLNIV